MLVSSIPIGTIFGLGGVYASQIGLTVSEIAFFMGSIVIGGALVQFSLGEFSRIIGRRLVIIGTCFVGATIAFFATQYTDYG